MPTLNWIGKDAVIKHHQEVPYRLLEPDAGLGLAGDDGTGGSGAPAGNLIVEGDNLHALKALLPRYAGQVKSKLSDARWIQRLRFRDSLKAHFG